MIGCQSLIQSGDECGIVAIGRCSKCGNAFCGSHQGFGYYGRLVDRCEPCEAKRKSDELRPYFERRSLIESAGELLATAGVERVAAYLDQYKWVKKRFRQEERVSCPEYWGDVWVIGKFRWEDDHDEEYQALTALPVQRAQYPYHDHGLCTIYQTDGKWMITLPGGGFKDEVRLAEYLRRLRDAGK